MKIHEDLLGTSLSLSGSGYSGTRIFVAEGFEGPPQRRMLDVLENALIPKPGDPHPVAPGATVQDINVNTRDDQNTVFEVSVTYGGNEEGTAEGLEGTGIKGFEISASTSTIKMRTDADGNVMQVFYVGPYRTFEIVGVSSNFTVGYFEGGIVDGSGFMEVEKENITTAVSITVERDRSALAEHFRIKGRVNQDTWGTKGPKEWLALGVDGSLQDNGKHTWNYHFSHNESTWMFTGKITEAYESNIKSIAQYFTLTEDMISPGNGIQMFDVYPSIPFSTLGFDIS